MGQNIYYTDEMLATLCDQPLNIMRVAIKTLEQFGMIETDNDGLIEIVNWEKHQNIDGMEKIRKQTAERQQLHYYRKKIKKIRPDINEDSLPEDVEELKELHKNLTLGLTLPNATEEDKDKEEDKNKNKESNTPSKKELESDFDKLWALYPNKKGKQTAFNAYRKAIKSGTTNRDIQEGIVAYKKLLKAESTDIQFIAHGSTWFNQQRWEDNYTIQPKQIPYKNNKHNTRSESLPEWVGKEEKDEKLSPEEEASFQKRLKEIREAKGASK